MSALAAGADVRVPAGVFGGRAPTLVESIAGFLFSVAVSTATLLATPCSLFRFRLGFRLEVADSVVAEEGTLPMRELREIAELDVSPRCDFVPNFAVEEDDPVMDVWSLSAEEVGDVPPI